MYCERCGKELSADSCFCRYCGAKVSNSRASGNADSTTAGETTQNREADSTATEYQVTFYRPSKITYMIASILITIDDSLDELQLANNSSLEVKLSPGTHQITFSMIGVLRSTKITLEVNQNRRLTCYPSAKAAVVNPLLIKPLVVEDENGQKL